jgi:integrase
VAVELHRRLHEQPAGWLFPGGCHDGQLHQERFYEPGWYPALASAGLGPDDDAEPGAGRYTFHALRYFCASTLLADGTPIAAVAGQLGDTAETLSRTYAHWLRDDWDVPADVLVSRRRTPVSRSCHGPAPTTPDTRSDQGIRADQALS